ncbi:subtilisin-like protease Pr1B [Cordyceps fumosorosea ARSEF 2679]|uniref:Subtilisin-like protease Pr1B n=1 Tax=Cordyceps fumosorosea (strain ARSEF 2679) TaxID=1081104 RepID=A0A168BKP3_CORFA|nr:subtilisin-like protease Pr1B [Cordyceps fumosorosea ARSEF 2679]OAA70236.1 subtilisin-like protease Pr1B [Cordyceps fumosorosea ARSEF 2679]
MLFLASFLASLAAAVELKSTVAPLFKPAGDVIPGRYIVKLKSDVSLLSVGKGILQHLSAPSHVYGSVFYGFAARLDEAQLEFVRLSPSVEFVEHDMIIRPSSYIDQLNAGWNLGRISHRKLGNTTYAYDSSAGAGTCCYVVDTGIAVDHAEFGGRAEQLVSFVGQNTDGNGHGTHISGVIGGATHGVAKRTRLYGVKVLDDNGSGTLANVIAGMDFVARDSKTRGCPRGAMANLSIGGSFSKAVNAAAAALVKAGVFVSASAGGSNGDAGKTSPASEPAVCTVAASTERDARAPFSDYGSVIDIFAPGTNIKSAWLGGTTQTLSGTAMAAAHITGLAAYVAALEGFPGAEELCKRIQALATKDVLTNIPNAPAGTPNLLAFNGNPWG